MSNLKDLTGMRFCRLTIIEKAESKNNHTRWKCKCDCGKETVSYTHSLTSGRTKSCGCLSHEKMKEANTKHGYTKTKLYSIWSGMKKRCYNSNYEHFNRYGGRGIEVCKEWENDFNNFKEWALSNGYCDGLEIDRINNDGNYHPNNCRWQTRTNQVRNRSNTVYLECDGIKKTLKEWCEIYGVNYKLAHQRYKKGWEFARIFNL